MVTEISSAKRAEIKSKSVIGLPNTVAGKPDTVKNAIFDPVNIVVGEINRVVEETNNDFTVKDKEHKAEIDKVRKLAEEHRFKADVIYDMSSPSANINRGFPNGVKWEGEITGLDLSKYRFLIIDCEFNRTLTMFMDLTRINEAHGFYINSMVGCAELRLDFKLIALEIIVNAEKTSIEVNNTIESASYSVTSELIPNKEAYVSKIYGIE